MPRFPFMPFPYYKVDPKYSAYHNNLIQKHIAYNNLSNKVPNNYSNNSTTSACEDSDKNKSNGNNDDYLFDLFGLKLYFDDILIVSLLYFLYSQGVKDEGLFIVLILLLLT